MTTASTQTNHDAASAVSVAADPRALRVVSILASGLPDELGTPGAPALYTVPAVFSRQVTAAERARIEDPETARRLAEATGADPELALSVDDRRLLIHCTSLPLLKDGLAAAIGQMLVELGDDLRAEQERVEAAAEILQSEERERSEAVALVAAEIRFDPPEASTARPGEATS